MELIIFDIEDECEALCDELNNAITDPAYSVCRKHPTLDKWGCQVSTNGPRWSLIEPKLIELGFRDNIEEAGEDWRKE